MQLLEQQTFMYRHQAGLYGVTKDQNFKVIHSPLVLKTVPLWVGQISMLMAMDTSGSYALLIMEVTMLSVRNHGKRNH